MMMKTVTLSPTRALEQHGQAIWLDYIRRTLLTSGELKRLVDEDGLSGVTSNPSIFDKAIAGSADYDEQIKRLLGAEAQAAPERVLDALMVDDIRMAAAVLRPVWERTGGADGYVSMEVSPALARDTAGSLAAARRLWQAVDRPNLMIKIPATPEGIPAIAALLAEGINVNITLMFSLAHYDAVANAFLDGVQRAATPEKIASVASVFVSRIDTAVDRALARLERPDALALRGKIAIANSKLIYRRFRELFSSERWRALAARGARPQRVLWASTSTKNPAYSDVLYVEELIGPQTVNTMPPSTLAAFRDHGRVRESLVEGVDAARALVERLKPLGLDLEAIAETLQQEGVAAFAESQAKLLASLAEKRRVLVAAGLDRQRLSLGGTQPAVDARLRAWQEAGVPSRLWHRDFTLWSEKPVEELTDRMGWLTLPEGMHEQAAGLAAFAGEIKDEGVRHVVLLGMGGSSLAPEVFQRTFGNAPGYPELVVLDSTHPGAVRAVEARIEPARAFFLVSSKSGTTTETLSLFYYFWEAAGRAGRRFAAITDPGTQLERLAAGRGFRRVFSAPPDVGGRYSALSVFGLVPAALIGVNVHGVLDEAWTMAESCAFCVPAPSSPGLALGAALGELALAGRDKITFLAAPAWRALPVWVEQLVAESTGKEGKGLVPVADEPPGAPAVYGNDRAFVSVGMAGEAAAAGIEAKVAALERAGHPVIRIQATDTLDLGQEFFRWEVAVAAAGAALHVHPFNQPDVQLAKDLAKQAMAKPGRAERAPTDAVAATAPEFKPALAGLLATARPGDYVGLQAYLKPSEETTAALQEIRVRLRDRLTLATTLGYGPRFLHSTGQLHKGGPNTGIFLQLVDEPAEDVPVPETGYSFGQLIRAQAEGDYQALKQRGRRVLRVGLGPDVAAGLAALAGALPG